MSRKNYNRNKVLTIVILSFITGTLDAIAAIIIGYPSGPDMVFKYIASGFFGRAAFIEDHMVLWGVFFHYLIATAFSIGFWVIYPKFKIGLKNKYFIGVVFGLMTWVVMNFAVLPLTEVAKQPEHASINISLIIKSIAALIICVGLPAAIISDIYYTQKARRAARRRVRNHYS